MSHLLPSNGNLSTAAAGTQTQCSARASIPCVVTPPLTHPHLQAGVLGDTTALGTDATETEGKQLSEEALAEICTLKSEIAGDGRARLMRVCVCLIKSQPTE